MSANDQIKAFIDRILRLKQEQDELSADIRDVYAEAKSQGFDKTALGNVVAHLRKVEKKGADTLAEQGAIFDLYLSAYEGSHTPAPARTREIIEEFPTPKGVEVGVDTPTASGSSSGRTSDFGSDNGGSNPSPETSSPPVRKPLRPHCLNPELCAGSGSNHCFRCRQAMQNAEVAA